MGNFAKHLFYVLFLFSLLLFVSFILLIIIGINLYTQSEERGNIRNYEVFKYNPITNFTSIEKTRIPKLLNHPIRYISPSGEYCIISNFEESFEYECIGECICLKDGKRRSAAIVLEKGLFLIVAAISSIVALSHAKHFFEKDCVEKFGEGCDDSDDEFDIKYDDEETDMDVFKVIPTMRCKKKGKEKAKPNAVRKYKCTGFCLTKHFVREEMSTVAAKFGCEKLTVSEDIDIMYGEHGRFHRTYAESLFRKTFLKPYCKEESKYKYLYHAIHNQNPKYVQKRDGTASLCCAKSPATMLQVKNVKCLLMVEYDEYLGKSPNIELGKFKFEKNEY